jgi:hypothetical protein
MASACAPIGPRLKVASAVAAILASMFSFTAHSFPGSPFQNYEAPSVTLISGCGKGNHRTREGQCVSGRAETVARASSGVDGVVCPPGTRLGNKGHNCKRID